MGEACREPGMTEQTYYRWRKEYGGMRVGQARRLEELQKESAGGESTCSGGSISPSVERAGS